MRVLQIAYGFEGGIGRLLVDYCSRLKQECQFEFLIGECQDGIFERRLIEKGFLVYHIKIGMPKKEKELFYKDFFSNYRYDIVHLHGSCDYICLKVAKKYGIQTRIVHSHNAVNYSKSKNMFYSALRNIYHELLNRLYVTDKWACGQKAGIAMWGKNNFFILPNAIDTSRFIYDDLARKRVRKYYSIAEDTLLVGTVGRLTDQKNHIFLLDVFSKLKDDNVNAELMIVGDGELKRELMKKSKEKGLNEIIHFVGNQTDVNAFLSSMDLFVLPSKFEGLPVVMIEAQSNGLRCLVSNKVTKECDVGKDNKFIGIDSIDVDRWVNEIRNESKKSNHRLSVFDLDKYNIDKSAPVLINEYSMLRMMKND